MQDNNLNNYIPTQKGDVPWYAGLLSATTGIEERKSGTPTTTKSNEQGSAL
jgi:hypothetical protein